MRKISLISLIILTFASDIYRLITVMAHSKIPTTVIKATPEVRRILDKMRANKRTQVEKLRKMKPEEFTIRIML